MELVIQCQNLKQKDPLCKCYPTVTISQIDAKTGAHTTLKQTEIIQDSTSPEFKAFRVQYYFEKQQKLKITIRDTQGFKQEPMLGSIIGSVDTTMGKIVAAKKSIFTQEIYVDGEKNISKGTLIIRSRELPESEQVKDDHAAQHQMYKTFTFLDYLKNDWQMQLTVAIDYTLSNGDPNDPESLHHAGPANQYEAAINMVGSIVIQYDYDKKVPVFGFGGIPKFMGQTAVSHCFPLNGNPKSPEVCGGIEPLLQLYRQSLLSIDFKGPTKFDSILSEFQKRILIGRDNPTYHLLLILTDGTIHDMSATKARLVDLSSQPVSVIIIGCGDEDFEMMEELDGDHHVLTDDDDRKVVRDIVQFVPFVKAVSKKNLPEEVLAEIPDQFMSYMKMNGITPAVSQQQQPQQQNPPQLPKPSNIQSALTPMDREIFETLNQYRTIPDMAVMDLKNLRACFNKDGLIAVPGETLLMSNEGVKAFDEAIKFMERMQPVAPLQLNEALTKAAEFHTKDIGPKGACGHDSTNGTSFADRIQRYIGQKACGENISFGDFKKDKGKRVVLQLLVDDGVPSRGHRTNMFKASFNSVGISSGPHQQYGSMTTMDFATL